tara:strand:- start:428 stop:574 length:147 start_codon:yes stop_codon:yes gene_type:complete
VPFKTLFYAHTKTSIPSNLNNIYEVVGVFPIDTRPMLQTSQIVWMEIP